MDVLYLFTQKRTRLIRQYYEQAINSVILALD